MTTTAAPTTFVISTAGHLFALSHPLRLGILHVLGDTPGMIATNAQLARLLGENAPKLHCHVRTLAAAGLIAIVKQQPKGGVIEKYYQCTAERYELAVGLLPGNVLLYQERVDAQRKGAGR